MKDQDTTKVMIGVNSIVDSASGFFQPLISPLILTNSVNYLYEQNIFNNKKQDVAFCNSVNNNNDFIKLIDLNFDCYIKPITYDIFNNSFDINYGFKPISIPSNNYIFSTNEKDSNVLNLSSILIYCYLVRSEYFIPIN